MTNISEANELFNNGHNCSQAIFVSHCTQFGLPADVAAKLALGFGGGVGRQGKICGCASGAILLLGLKYGQGSTSDVQKRNHCYDVVKAFCQRFAEVNGALDCKDIIRYNLNNIEERKKAQEANVFKNRCAHVVASTEQLLKEFL